MIRSPQVVLFLIGVALSIAQFVMIRDFVTILYGEEVVIVLVTSSFFLGLSAGYLLSLRLSVAAFRVLFVASIFLHLTFPFSYRYLASDLSARGASGWSFLGLLFGYALLFNAAFACFLPRLVTHDPEPDREPSSRLRNYYAFELAGFMTGFGMVALSWNRPAYQLLLPYWVLLGVLLHLTLRRLPVTGAYGVLAVAAMLLVGKLDRHSNGLLYEIKHRLDGAAVLYSVNSPYQRVEVIEDVGGERYLFLDGLMNLNQGGLDVLNHYIATVPAQLVRPHHALMIGNGTLSSVPRLYPLTGRLTSVELDAGVLAAGRRFFTSGRALEGLERWRLVVDDGKHFLRSTQDRFDLVIVDVPSPFTIQEGCLYTVEFYRLVRERLTERGVVSVQLSGQLRRNNDTAAQVTAALRQVFPEVLVVFSEEAERGFAYASPRLPFDAADVRAAAGPFEGRLALIPPSGVDAYLVEATPFAVDQMDTVLRRGWERFVNRYFDD